MFTNRFLLAVGILSLLLVSLVVASPLTHETEPVDTSLPPRPIIRPVTAVSNSDAYHQSEWTYVPLRASLADALAAYHRSEWSSVAIPVTGMSGIEVYHRSERTLVDPNAGLEIYQLSERTLVVPQAGMTIYRQSERTSVPVRLNKYQLSEWFGK